jgi:cell wall-associated NlpC family hydrolase
MVVLPAGIGAASPSSHPSISQVESQVNALNIRAEKITESYDSANTSLVALQRKEKATNDLLTRDRAALAKVQRQVAATASAAYRNGAVSPALSLVSSGSPQTFLDRASSLDEVAHVQASQAALANAAQRQVSAAEVVHNAEIAQQKKTLSSIASSKSQVEGLIGQENSLLGKLKASQRAALAAQQQAAVHTEVAQRTTYNPPTYNGPATGNASAAISYAYAQLGKPYQWGGAGPDSFDCSGLVMRAWGAAGVSLPHSAAGDQASLPSVSLSALEPGDLVFYGDPAFHVALYIGGGRIIQAPHTGANVEISSIDDMTPTSAGRP